MRSGIISSGKEWLQMRGKGWSRNGTGRLDICCARNGWAMCNVGVALRGCKCSDRKEDARLGLAVSVRRWYAQKGLGVSGTAVDARRGRACTAAERNGCKCA